MKVKELIKQLQKCNQEADLVTYDDNRDYRMVDGVHKPKYDKRNIVIINLSGYYDLYHG